jgi:hypothetical protein
MKRLGASILLGGAVTLATIARGGHELPIYPSFYPHEIEIRTLAPGNASAELRDGKIQAYLGEGLDLAGTVPEQVRAIESLGSLVVAQINPESARMQTEVAACDAVKAVLRELARQSDVVVHPYPVTPFHGDYLYHADLAAAAKTRFGGDGSTTSDLKVKASGRLARDRSDWSARGVDWDVELLEIDAAALTASGTFSVNGWYAPPWVRTGWFHAERLLADAVDEPTRRERAQADVQRLKSGDFSGLAERTNLERDLVTALTAGCRKIVAGYTVKRQSINVEYSAGIENVGYDAIDGLRSPIFIRTVKLKDFPWNGWLALGIDSAPTAAWNPIGGMTDPFGRMLGFAVGDPALLPSPYESGWMLNRVSDLPTNAGR